MGLLQLGSPVGVHSLSTQAALDEALCAPPGVATTADGGPTPPTSPSARSGAGGKCPSGSEVAGSAVAHLPDSVHDDVRALVDAINAEFPNSVW